MHIEKVKEMVKLPKDTKNWKDDVIGAVKWKFNDAVAKGKRDQNNWSYALDQLQTSPDPIFLQKGGINVGMIKGIPTGLRSDKMKAVIFFIEKIVKEEEPVPIALEHEARQVDIPHITDMTVR